MADHLPSPRLSRAAAVNALVRAATDLLAQEGPHQLKARTVAAAAGMSASAVYHHLGGLPELLQAVVDLGFAELADRFVRIGSTSDAVADLFEHALTMRHFAQANPHRYDLMFGLSTRGTYRAWQPERRGGQSEMFRDAYDQLVAACRRVLSEHPYDSGDPGSLADQLWCCVHGFVTLEMGAHLGKNSVEGVLKPMTVNIISAFGLPRDAVERSHTRALTRLGTDL